jgi:hypothetical protein
MRKKWKKLLWNMAMPKRKKYLNLYYLLNSHYAFRLSAQP